MCITEYNEKTFVNGIREEGREEGRIEGTVKTLTDLSIPYTECITKLVKDFSISEEEAKKYYDMYSPQTV